MDKTVKVREGMSMKVTPRGELHLVLKDKNGKLKEDRLTIDKRRVQDVEQDKELVS